MKKSALALVGSLLVASSVQAIEQNVKINLNSQLIQDQSRLPLKRMVKRQLGIRNLNSWNLKKVEISAKSQFGDGEAELDLGGRRSSVVNIPGNEAQFESNFSGFHNLTLNTPYTSQAGRWKLMIYGPAKLDAIKVKLTKQLEYDYSRVGRVHFTHAVNLKADKVVGSTKTVHIGSRLKAIELVGTKKKAKVTGIEIHFMDGQVVTVTELNGSIRDGNIKHFALKGILARPVNKIKVSAITTSLFGSRGRFDINIAK